MKTLRKTLPISCALALLAVVSATAQAAEPDQITISAPSVHTVGRDRSTLTPIQEVVVTAHVKFDPVTLTTNSGVALLKDSVLEAARKSCRSADPFMEDDGTCIRTALEDAQPQITAAIARARANANG
jgi:UrcA family protein